MKISSQRQTLRFTDPYARFHYYFIKQTHSPCSLSPPVMPPRTSVTSSPSRSSAPYARRSSGQPKSSRQQFSACGACRMRRCVQTYSRLACLLKQRLLVFVVISKICLSIPQDLIQPAQTVRNGASTVCKSPPLNPKLATISHIFHKATNSRMLKQ